MKDYKCTYEFDIQLVPWVALANISTHHTMMMTMVIAVVLLAAVSLFVSYSISFIYQLFEMKVRRYWFRYHFKVDITNIKDMDYTTMFQIIKLKK